MGQHGEHGISHQLVAERVGMRVTGHRKQLLRRTSEHRGKKIDVDVAVAPGDTAHDVVNEAKLVVDQVVHVGRHRQKQPNMMRSTILRKLVELLLHPDEARRVRLIRRAIVIDQSAFAGFVEQPMVGNPQRHAELAVPQNHIPASRRQILGVAQEIVDDDIRRLQAGELLEKT